MQLSTQRDLVLDALNNMRTANEIATSLKSSENPEIAELAKAVNLLAYGSQQIGLALTDTGRERNLSV